MLHVDEYRDWKSLATLRDAWNALLPQTVGATYFHSYDWLETYWQHFGDKQRLRILAVRRGQEVVGIVPLTILREPSPLGSVRILTYPMAYWGSFYGPIGPEARKTLRAALDHVHRTSRSWDLLDLRFAPPDELDPADSAKVMSEAGFMPQASPTDSTSIIDLPATFDDYLATRTSKWRMNHRRWTRRLHEQGEIRFVRYLPTGEQNSDADPRWDLYDDCESVARQSWQGSSTTGTTITHESVREYFRAAHATACRAGAADLNLLYVNDRPAAFFYGYAYRGNLYGLRIGFDEQISKVGAGNLLYLHVIQDSIARGYHTFDLGPGSLKAKEAITSRVVPIRRLTYGNPLSFKGLLWRAKKTFADFGGEESHAAELAEEESLNF